MNRTLLSKEKIAALKSALAKVERVDGDLAELGVYRGGVAHLLATTYPERTVHLFDTFAGIPANGMACDGHKQGEYAADEADVRQYLADCPNVAFHVGVFPETAMGERFALVHLDADLYASTKAGLEWFWPRLSPGGCLVLDDWQWRMCPGVEWAVAEYFAFKGKAEARFRDSAENQLTVWKL